MALEVAHHAPAHRVEPERLVLFQRQRAVAVGVEGGQPVGAERVDGDKSQAVTLEDRIGKRLRSRLFEMCVPVEMSGADFRRMKRPVYR